MNLRRIPGAFSRCVPTVAFLGLGCAHVEPPPGGPVDTASPKVVAVFPAPGARNVDRGVEFEIQFSEWIDRAAARGRMVLSPPPPGRLKAEVDGDRLRIHPPSIRGGLLPNTAYRLTVLGIKDLHGVSMGRPFSLAFTTGGGFDSGAVSGEVSAADAKGFVLAALYRRTGRENALPRSFRELGSFQPDSTPEPTRELPSFLAPADSTGAFRLDSVSQGNYAVLAFADLDGDLAPDPGLEPIGMGTLDVPLRPRAARQSLRLTPLDTALLRVRAARFAADTVVDGKAAGLVRLQFTRPVRPISALDARHYGLNALSPDAGRDSASIRGAGWDAAVSEWVVETSPLKLGARYRFRVHGVTDLSGNGMGPQGDSVEFQVEAKPDSAAWSLMVLNPPDASGALTPAPPAGLLAGDSLTLHSNRRLSPERWRVLEERLELRQDTATVKPRLSRQGPVGLGLKVERPWRPGQSLRLRLRPVPSDTLARVLGGGQVFDSVQIARAGFRVPAQWKEWTFVLQGGMPPGEILAGPGRDSLELGPLAPGRHRLSAFLDRDHDRVWHPGSLRPWVAQEPYSVVLDTLTLNGGVFTDLTLRLRAISDSTRN